MDGSQATATEIGRARWRLSARVYIEPSSTRPLASKYLGLVQKWPATVHNGRIATWMQQNRHKRNCLQTEFAELHLVFR